MKTPEQIAHKIIMNRDDFDENLILVEQAISDAIAAERAKADALAEALRVIDIAIKEMTWADGLDTNVERIESAARAALAAYESDGETEG